MSETPKPPLSKPAKMESATDSIEAPAKRSKFGVPKPGSKFDVILQLMRRGTGATEQDSVKAARWKQSKDMRRIAEGAGFRVVTKDTDGARRFEALSTDEAATRAVAA